MSDSIVTGRQPPNLELDNIILKCMVWQKKTAKHGEIHRVCGVHRRHSIASQIRVWGDVKAASKHVAWPTLQS